MPRYALKIEYDGGPFSGWQRQVAFPSVQGAIEAALARIAPEKPLIQGAGRTDAGVHAHAQVAHVDLAREWDPFRLAGAINYHLKPAPVAILDVAPVADDFHARFSASGRRYIFRLLSRRAPVTLERGQVWQVGHPLELAPMQEAARLLLGHHDFTTFRSSTCQAASPMKTLDRLEITRRDLTVGAEFTFDVRARSFLHNQVRSFVGTLERVGVGAWHPEDVARALEARDRSACGPVSPPQGLYLAGVDYPRDPFASAAS
ncbi:tRNA pseudouridine(38-40) synthase TruA [Brevirhabdus pacifica]|uniref:tRNA pseudouridine synthase A n=1 Tax=Brevirhabdus pacifica TaxID=1267768 RepID=A0A1U7DK35_9RHOB|nr:tRNA pseudouridine(38-40) synthase TruA [Brevirhabdus pacifica]APX90350.1 tRNA pseudouridine(38-40) synthase TruA [Brevirhabdus pacifica]OWU78617.1 pseudouridine synthase [Loktanella sp. 22II-4b]PJJ80804.1 tRNA pseudouridine38-40 synthase [Brevirhabdus pacifica]